ncbi:FAM49 family protein [Cavenderia fasciculata]|uniref:FAM49 family protein n=1 Tax=Cavenderia fasciculata TaxID=261658 RepID=F4QDB6_CACFS|nr:FAM49 family protein [Cavenderia fasciculata]EGG13744.1 FAM49 family protein [Cavenderia fasciculata]|eukprot:XP_004350448.1 FAM49 family protein [Cavenderia fasciculata]
MGQLLSFINGTEHTEQIFIDFENAQPSEEERELYNSVGEVLNRGPKILEKLISYAGCNEYIRRAITNPGPETEDAAWEAVLPAVDELQEFYDYSLELEKCFPKLLVALCKGDPKSSLSNQQALAKQLADVFDFVLRFDDAKMVNPAIQNDFSYYRRTLNRMKLTKKDANIKIRDELANRMSLFFAYPTPMMKVLSETTAKFLQTETTVPRENVTTALATMANVCHDMVDNKKFNNNDINMFCLRAMVGSIILFDHIHPQGAFVKKSSIYIKGCIVTLKDHNSLSSTDGLLNALRFTTIHLNDPETPGSIKQLL